MYSNPSARLEACSMGFKKSYDRLIIIRYVIDHAICLLTGNNTPTPAQARDADGLELTAAVTNSLASLSTPKTFWITPLSWISELLNVNFQMLACVSCILCLSMASIHSLLLVFKRGTQAKSAGRISSRLASYVSISLASSARNFSYATFQSSRIGVSWQSWLRAVTDVWVAFSASNWSEEAVDSGLEASILQKRC